MSYNLVEIMRDLPGDPFEYFLCVDFESTCWCRTENRYQELVQEVIEFAVVLARPGKILGEFREFVRPVENPTLTSFCTKLTGITQEMADSGILLVECLKRFTVWLKGMIDQHNLVLPKTSTGDMMMGNAVFCSWGHWDPTQIQRECHRKKIPEVPYFDQWMDVKRLFHGHYEKEMKMLQSMHHVGLEFEGQQHTGLDDARNLASLVTKMKQDGVVFRITRDNIPHLELNELF